MHRIEEIEKALNLLDTYDGQLSKTARALGINRYTLRSWRDKRKCRSNMVGAKGLEPLRYRYQWILSPSRLPFRHAPVK